MKTEEEFHQSIIFMGKPSTKNIKARYAKTIQSEYYEYQDWQQKVRFTLDKYSRNRKNLAGNCEKFNT